MKSDPLAAAMPVPTANPLARPASTPLQPGAAATSSASAGTAGPNWLLIGIGGGGAALVLVVIIGIVIAMSGGTEVAEAPAPSEPPAAAPTAPSQPPASSPPTSTAPSVAASAPATAQVAAATGSTFGSTAPSAVSAATKPADPAPASVAAAPPLKPSGRHVLSDLPAGVHAWHNDGRGKLVGIFNRKEDENPNAQLSWMTALLPHLGYQKHYDMLARDKPITEKANLQVGVQTIPEFLNPIEGKSRWSGYPFDGLALTHFAGMSGVEDARNVCAGELPRSDPRAGVFGYDTVAKPSEITDGTSQTVMIVGSGPLASPWIMGGGATIRGWREPLFDPVGGLGMRGLPNGGTVVVMADGSVRQIPANIDPKVFRAMCTIHGAETIDLQQAPSFNLEEWK